MTRWIAAALTVLATTAPPIAPDRAVRVERISAPEKILRFSIVVPAPVDDVWRALTTSDGLTTWLWSDARVDLRAGGDWLVLLPGSNSAGGTIVSFDAGRRLTLDAMAPEQFPTVRRERTRAVFELAQATPSGTTVTLTQSGWKVGAEWDAAYEYLAVGNAQLLAQLRQRFDSGPFDWAKSPATPAPVRLTSYLTPDGSRVLRHEVDVKAAPADVWRAFTTTAGLKAFVAPVVSIDLRLGGMWESSYDPNAHLGDPGNILNEVISFLPERMLSIRVARTPPGFQHADVAKQVWTVIEIADLGQGRSRVATSMCGWKSGPDWDAVYSFFERDNTIVAEHLRDYLNGQR